MRLAMGQLRLYPVNSPQAQKSLTNAHAAIATFPGAQGKLVMARTLRGFLINSKRLPAGDAAALVEKFWLQAFNDAHINSLVIQTSLALEELSIFMDGLSKRFWDFKDGKAINKRLRDERCIHAWVEEVQFVAMSKGDLLIEGAANKLAAAGARVAEIVETLEQVIDGTVADGLGEQVRLEIMRKLLQQDPTLIAKAQAMTFAVDEHNASGEEDEDGEGGGGGGGGGDGTGTGGGRGGGAAGRGPRGGGGGGAAPRGRPPPPRAGGGGPARAPPPEEAVKEEAAAGVVPAPAAAGAVPAPAAASEGASAEESAAASATASASAWEEAGAASAAAAAVVVEVVEVVEVVAYCWIEMDER